jgi:hypothetical protein
MPRWLAFVQRLHASSSLAPFSIFLPEGKNSKTSTRQEYNTGGKEFTKLFYCQKYEQEMRELGKHGSSNDAKRITIPLPYRMYSTANFATASRNETQMLHDVNELDQNGDKVLCFRRG